MSQVFKPGTGGGAGTVNTLTPDVGSVVTPVANNIDIHGINGIVTSNTGAGSLTISGGVGILQTITKTLTSAQVKNLSTVPQTIIPAQGAGTVIVVYCATAKIYVPTGSAFTDPGAAQCDIIYFNGGQVQVISGGFPTSAFMTSTSNSYIGLVPAGMNLILASQIENASVVVTGANGVGNWGGNAANDNTVVFSYQYVVIAI